MNEKEAKIVSRAMSILGKIKSAKKIKTAIENGKKSKGRPKLKKNL